jgi:Tfp pilus assembly protein PilO
VNRRQVLLVALPPVAVLLAWFALAWLPQRERRADAADRIEALDAQNAAALAQLGAARERALDADATSVDLARLRARIPDDPDVGGFVLMNQSLALESGVTLTDVTPQADVEERFLPGAEDLPPTLEPTVVSISGTGSFPALWDYVDRLSQAPRLVIVDAIAFDAEEEGVLRCVLRVRIFSTRAASEAATTGVDDVVTEAVPK